uniref:Uncharacterized protein n=1 Tax=candidate division WOR-3 bacterium TaxID=2052148 RepID=A0A7C3UR24_UNCW3
MPVQDEPAQPTFPIPPSENDLSSTDFKIVKFETPDSQIPIYELRCYTHTRGGQTGNKYFLYRACSTAAYNPITNQPVTLYYIDVFGPYWFQYLRLETDFGTWLKSDPVSKKFNAHVAGLYKYDDWEQREGDHRIVRAPSSHMAYPVPYPGLRIGDVPGTYSFTAFPSDKVVR